MNTLSGEKRKEPPAREAGLEFEVVSPKQPVERVILRALLYSGVVFSGLGFIGSAGSREGWQPFLITGAICIAGLACSAPRRCY